MIAKISLSPEDSKRFIGFDGGWLLKSHVSPKIPLDLMTFVS